MFTFIRRLQQKPEAQRRAFALWAALGITLCIFILWLTSFFSSLGTNGTAVRDEEDDVSPIRSITEMVSSFGPFFEDIFGE